MAKQKFVHDLICFKDTTLELQNHSMKTFQFESTKWNSGWRLHSDFPWSKTTKGAQNPHKRRRYTRLHPTKENYTGTYCSWTLDQGTRNLHTPNLLTGWIQQQFLHPVLIQQWETFSWGTWEYWCDLANSVVEGATKVHTYNGTEHETNPGHFQRCNPRTPWHAPGHQQVNHKPSGDSCRAPVCHEGKAHPEWRFSGLQAIGGVVV